MEIVEIQLVPEAGSAAREAVLAALRTAGLEAVARPFQYASPWRSRGLAEGVERASPNGEAGAQALSPRNTRGAMRA